MQPAHQTLTTASHGPSHTLQPHPNPPHRHALHLAPSSTADLTWTLTPALEIPHRWHFATTLPDGRVKRLDLYNDNSGDKTRVCLADPGRYLGQFWELVPCEDGEKQGAGAGYFKLSNDWTGSGWFLDVDPQTRTAVMRDGEGRVQRWRIEMAPQMADVEAQRGRGVQRSKIEVAVAVMMVFALMAFIARVAIPLTTGQWV